MLKDGCRRHKSCDTNVFFFKSLALHTGLCHFTFSYQRPLYHFINNPKDWLTAQQYCRDMYTDLATITDEQDLEDLAGLVGSGGPFVYLGLYRDWGWSVSENDDYKVGEPAYWNWASGEPSVQSCASMSATGGWSAIPCNSTLSFVCYTGKIFNTFLCCLPFVWATVPPRFETRVTLLKLKVRKL